MAKRFTDSDKWKKPLIRSLKAPYKLLWLYILDDCDHAGIWQVDMDVAEIRIGEKLNEQEAIKSFGNKIILIESGQKWFIRDFIDFQYGELKEGNRVHDSVLSIFKKYKIKEYISPLQGRKDKDKDMDKDMDKDEDKDMDKDSESKIEILTPASEILQAYNEITDKKLVITAKGNLKHINARLAEGFTIEELVEIIHLKYWEWKDDDKMRKYLTPDTLFNSEKCHKYRQQVIDAKKNPQQFKQSLKSNNGNKSGKTEFEGLNTPFGRVPTGG